MSATAMTLTLTKWYDFHVSVKLHLPLLLQKKMRNTKFCLTVCCSVGICDLTVIGGLDSHLSGCFWLFAQKFWEVSGT